MNSEDRWNSWSDSRDEARRRYWMRLQQLQRFEDDIRHEIDHYESRADELDEILSWIASLDRASIDAENGQPTPERETSTVGTQTNAPVLREDASGRRGSDSSPFSFLKRELMSAGGANLADRGEPKPSTSGLQKSPRSRRRASSVRRRISSSSDEEPDVLSSQDTKSGLRLHRFKQPDDSLRRLRDPRTGKFIAKSRRMEIGPPGKGQNKGRSKQIKESSPPKIRIVSNELVNLPLWRRTVMDPSSGSVELETMKDTPSETAKSTESSPGIVPIAQPATTSQTPDEMAVHSDARNKGNAMTTHDIVVALGPEEATRKPWTTLFPASSGGEIQPVVRLQNDRRDGGHEDARVDAATD